MKNLMKNNKLIIGMVHFPPLPGTPEFDDNLDIGYSKLSLEITQLINDKVIENKI